MQFTAFKDNKFSYFSNLSSLNAQVEPKIAAKYTEADNFSKAMTYIEEINEFKLSELEVSIRQIPAKLLDLQTLPEEVPQVMNIQDKTQINSQSSLHGPSKGPQKLHSITIYCFGQPRSITIQYKDQLKVSECIEEALLKCKGHQNINSTEYQLWPSQEGSSHTPNNSAQALRPSTLINCYQSLVLLQTNTKKSLLSFNKAVSHPSSLTFYDEKGELLATMEVSEYTQLKEVLEKLKKQIKNITSNYFLTSDNFSQEALPLDLQLSNLVDYSLYLKKKAYIDAQIEQQNQNYLLKRTETLGTDPLLPPIGLREASKYEQFELIKINIRGSEQKRIIGIDFDKIYNYNLTNRRQKRQESFFGQMLGFNKETGTKKPYRLISDIRSISCSKREFTLKFKEKNLTFLAPSPQIAQKVVMKLEYILHYQKNISK